MSPNPVNRSNPVSPQRIQHRHISARIKGYAAAEVGVALRSSSAFPHNPSTLDLIPCYRL
jgi:hypothetical protein